MDIAEIHFGDNLYHAAKALRYKLFFEEHGSPKEVLNDSQEIKSTHIAMSSGHELIAYGRLTEITPTEFQISQLVVSPSFQKRGYGTQLLIYLMKLCRQKNASYIVLNARTNSVGLYEKQGFKKLDLNSNPQ